MGKVLTSRRAGSPDHIIISQPKVVNLSSDKDIHFTGTLVKNASEQENLTGLLSDKIIIHEVSIGAAESLHFRLEFYSKDTFSNTDLNVDTFVGSVEFDLPRYGEVT